MIFNPDLSKQAQEVIFSRKIKKLLHPTLLFKNISLSNILFQKHLGLTLDIKLLRTYLVLSKKGKNSLRNRIQHKRVLKMGGLLYRYCMRWQKPQLSIHSHQAGPVISNTDRTEVN